jgi:hypothetical protein
MQLLVPFNKFRVSFLQLLLDLYLSLPGFLKLQRLVILLRLQSAISAPFPSSFFPVSALSGSAQPALCLVCFLRFFRLLLDLGFRRLQFLALLLSLLLPFLQIFKILFNCRFRCLRFLKPLLNRFFLARLFLQIFVDLGFPLGDFLEFS